MADYEAPTSNEYQLQCRILQLIPLEFHQEIEENGELRAIRDHCITGEKVAEEFINEILDGMAEAESKLERARHPLEEMSAEVRWACCRSSLLSHHEEKTLVQYEALHRQWKEAIAHRQDVSHRDLYQELVKARLEFIKARKEVKEAQHVVKQWEAGHWQAQVMYDTCLNEEHSRRNLGEVAISAVLEKQSRRSNGAWKRIQASLPV